jgi:hypothetical protein
MRIKVEEGEVIKMDNLPTGKKFNSKEFIEGVKEIKKMMDEQKDWRDEFDVMLENEYPKELWGIINFMPIKDFIQGLLDRKTNTSNHE